MEIVVAKKNVYAELTHGRPYEVYGRAVKEDAVLRAKEPFAAYPVYGAAREGVIILNDAGLLAAYKEDNFL